METMKSSNVVRDSKRVSIIAIMTALALVGNYVLVAIPNVELGSTVLFVTAYIFGIHIAAWVTIIMSLLFGIINPWGGFIPQIWVSQVIGWFYIITVGSIMGKQDTGGKNLEPRKWELAITGAFVTLIFEQITNLGYSASFGVPYIVAFAAAIPFSIIHIISNTLIFSQVVPMLNSILRKQLKDLIWNTGLKIEVNMLESNLD
ncbi:hypothetical protein EU527_02015 [Candidatus Thorarchaeota archaeon]|nr:MAG: hypothetical protein EU527_02015 [Candidatus Thorarchaeota archaeon]